MGRKKKQVEKQYIWCYYCDREFEDENTLISHQVARHFKCEYCGKKLGTFRGLMSHAKTNHHVDLPAFCLFLFVYVLEFPMHFQDVIIQQLIFTG